MVSDRGVLLRVLLENAIRVCVPSELQNQRESSYSTQCASFKKQKHAAHCEQPQGSGDRVKRVWLIKCARWQGWRARSSLELVH